MHNLHHKLYVIEGFNGMLYVFSSHCYCHPVIYSLSLFIIYSVNSFIANVICYITIPSLNKVLYLVSFLYGKQIRRQTNCSMNRYRPSFENLQKANLRNRNIKCIIYLFIHLSKQI